MIEIKIQIDDIDYNSTAEALMPILAEHLKENGGALSSLAGLFSSPGSLGAASAKAIISKMPKSAKDDLIVRALEANKDKLTAQLEQLGGKNGLIFKITAASAEKK